LLDADAERGILLLERILPGTPLSDVTDDQEATAIAAQVMRRLWRPAPAEHRFPTVARWAAGLQRLHARFGGGTGPFPAATIARAEGLFAELIASSTEDMLLHGDFHHWNVLTAGREPWLALDPKGIVGDPGYEVGPWIANRIPDDMDAATARRSMARLLDQLAEALPYDRARLRSWALAQFVLSAWWSYEDHGYGWEPTIAKAEVLANA
jgi:streptomycin 6-kinase